MEKMTDSSIHRREEPRRGRRTGLPGWSGVAGVLSGDMAPLLPLGRRQMRFEEGFTQQE